MKKAAFFFAIMILAASICSCGAPAGTLGWQEQYDLGLRYLSEGRYQEAIIAFTAAVEIDPRHSEVYVSRGDAYVLSGETAENLAAALVDYENAVELDETNVGAYLGQADVYIRQGEYDQALEILRQGSEKTGNDGSIGGKIAEIERGNITDSAGNLRRKSSYDADGALMWTTEYQYDARGYKTGWTNTHYENGAVSRRSYAVVEFGKDGYPSRNIYYNEDGTPTGSYDEMVFNNLGQEVERYKYYASGGMMLYKYYYDKSGRRTHYETYENGNEYAGRTEYLYDENGVAIGEVDYNAQGEVISSVVYE